MMYLVTFRPLEPYTFGTDQTFEYLGTGKTGKESYLASSRTLPEQTSLLGALRYMALVQAKLLRSDFCYSSTEREKIAACVGPESFRFFECRQSFGRIHALSPLFLFHAGTQAILIPNPFHNRAKETGFEPIELGELVMTSQGSLALPKEGQYKAKVGHAKGFLELGTLAVYKEFSEQKGDKSLFSSRFIAGNRKAEDEEEREKGYFRRELVTLREGYSFAVLADTEEGALPESCLVYMGLKKAAFRAESRLLSDYAAFSGRREGDGPSDVLKRMVEERLHGEAPCWYALSDCLLAENARYAAFSIVEQKHLRALETRLEKTAAAQRLRRSEYRVHLVSAGSVFYGLPELDKSSGERLIGYNTICKVGG